MNDPLTPDEWDALHRAMDRVDRARHVVAPEGPNEGRVRAAVLATYRQQGVEVDPRDVERAVKEALPRRPVLKGRWVRAPSPVLAWTRARGWKPSTRWDGGPRPTPYVNRRGPFDWLNSKLDAWNWEVESLQSHVPLDDDALWNKLTETARHQLKVHESSGRCGALCGVGFLASSIAGVFFSSLALGGLAVVLAVAGLAWYWRHLEAMDALGHLGEALQALRDKQWEHPAFALCLPQMGLVHLGSMQPIAIKSKEWNAAFCAAEPHKRLHATLRQWRESRSLRINDALVMQRMAAVQSSHPLSLMLKAANEKIKAWWPRMNREK